jgi:hypothetical protein
MRVMISFTMAASFDSLGSLVPITWMAPRTAPAGS